MLLCNLIEGSCALTTEYFKDLLTSNNWGSGYICTRLLLPEIRCQCFIRIFLTFWLAGLKVLTNGKIFLDDFGLFLIAVLRDEKELGIGKDAKIFFEREDVSRYA